MSMSTTMSTSVFTNRFELNSIADIALKAAVRFWFGVMVIGQLIFAFTVASFYGMTSARGDLLAWRKSIRHGYIPGDTMGNLAIVVYLTSAVIVILSGLFHLIPQVLERVRASYI